MGTFDSKDARASFAAMQGGGANPGMNGLLANPAVQKDESLEKAFTRDYSSISKGYAEINNWLRQEQKYNPLDFEPDVAIGIGLANDSC